MPLILFERMDRYQSVHRLELILEDPWWKQRPLVEEHPELTPLVPDISGSIYSPAGMRICD